jgi:hypothetical protein
MADRCTLHRSKLLDFRQWLADEGWTHASLGEWQAVKAFKIQNEKKAWLIVYDRSRGDHLSLDSASFRVVQRYLSVTKHQQRTRPTAEMDEVTARDTDRREPMTDRDHHDDSPIS